MKIKEVEFFSEILFYKGVKLITNLLILNRNILYIILFKYKNK
jgi:hypothetical protein